jgi:aspartate aminotransferase
MKVDKTMDLRLTKRMSRISASQTMAVAEAATRLREKGLDVVDLSAGEPDFPTPENVKQAAVRAIEENFSKYTAASGITELKKAVVERHCQDFGSSYDVSEVMITVGAKHAIFNVFSALVEDGDEVVIPAPYWVTFADVARFVGGQPVFVQTLEESGFRLTADMVASALTPKTRLLVVNSPCNPSGAVLDDDEFVRIAELCRDRNVVLLSDECYAYFLYEGRHPFSIASRRDLKDTIVIVGAASKTYAMTGWRVGFVLATADLIKGMNKLQSHSTSNPTSIAQKAAVEAFRGPQQSVAMMLAEYTRRRRYVVDRLRAIPGFRCSEPGGAFYAYPNVSVCFDRGIKDTVDFSVQLLEQRQVAVVPGIAFGTHDHVRISYAASMESLKEALDRIEAFMGELG